VMDTVRRHVPHAEFFTVPGGTHYSLLEYPELVVARIEAWFDQHFSAWAGSPEASAT